MTELERTNAELRAALIVAGKLNFGRRNDPVLPILRRVLRESRRCARATGGGLVGASQRDLDEALQNEPRCPHGTRRATASC